MLENLLEYYRKSDGATKKKILGCIFAEKFVLESGRVATSTFTELIQLIISISEVLGSSQKKQEVENDLLYCFVPSTDKNCNRVNNLLLLKYDKLLKLQF